MKHILKIYFILLCALILVFQVKEPRAAETCSSQECHPRIGGGKIVHAPLVGGECSACHEGQNATHPSGTGNDFTLTAEGSDLCFGCHDRESFAEKIMHGPVAYGGCTVCHSPHSASFKGLLRLAVKDLCLNCHTDFAQNIRESQYIHSAIQERDCAACHDSHGSSHGYLLKGDSTEICFECHGKVRDKYRQALNKHKPLYVQDKCGNCHSAHFSNYQSLLLAEGKDLCFTCHGQTDTSRSKALRNIKQEIEGKKIVHAPLAEGECAGCHDVHGSSFSLLLIAPYPGSFYAPYRPESYGLCFQCHDEELLVSERTVEGTGFRNGEKNLHFLHVAKKEKGRTCKACHSVHASDGEKLINPDGIPFGNWRVPVKFKVLGEGGSCVPGCRREMSYDREQPVDNTLKDDKTEQLPVEG